MFSAACDPNTGTSLSVLVGAEFGGKLELLDASGALLEARDYDTSLIAGGAFRMRF